MSNNDPHHQQYDDGLEVAPSDAGLEVAPSYAPEAASSPGWTSSAGGTSTDYDYGKIPVVAEPYHQYKAAPDGAMAGPGHSAGAYAGGGAIVTRRPWWRKKAILGIIAAVLVVGIGLGVGLGVGLTIGSSSSSRGDDGDSNNDSSSSDGDNDSPCEGDFCARILSSSIYNGSLYIFARDTAKETMLLLEHDGDDWQDWTDIGGILTYDMGIPTSQTWKVNGTEERMDLFVTVNDVRKSAYNTYWTYHEPGGGWERLGNNIGGPVATCSVHTKGEEERLDVWGVDATSNDVVKTMWRYLPEDEVSLDGREGITNETGSYQPSPDWAEQDPLNAAKPQPAVLCPKSESDSERFHDMVYYDPDKDKAFHHSFSKEDGWSSQTEWEGKWIGHPSIYTTNSKGTEGHFFGVQENHELYHVSWNEDGVFSDDQPQSLSTVPIYSSPAFYVHDDGTLHLVALTTGDVLQHMYKGSGADSWESESLFVKASSAPVMRLFNDKLYIFAVNKPGQLKAWTVDHEEESWHDTVKEEQGGPFDSEGGVSLDY